MRKLSPRCFDSRRQYELWVEVARCSHPGGSSYCTDCSAQYQRRMIASQRCAYPGTMFHVAGDGLIEGRRPVEDCIRHREVA